MRGLSILIECFLSMRARVAAGSISGLKSSSSVSCRNFSIQMGWVLLEYSSRVVCRSICGLVVAGDKVRLECEQITGGPSGF